MRKIRHLFIIAIFSIFSSVSPVFSSVFHANNNPPSNLVYCPESIECAEEGKIKSCKAIGGSPEFDFSNWLYENGRVVKGVYNFEFANGFYQSSRPEQARCYYSNFDSGFKKELSSVAPYYGNLQAHYNKTNSWAVSGYYAQCTGSSKRCPFVEKAEVVFYIKVGAGLYCYVNGILLKGAPNYNLVTLNYEEVANACSGKDKCSIEIFRNTSEQSGSILIDLTNNMKILSVSSKSGHILKKIEPFNSVDVT